MATVYDQGNTSFHLVGNGMPRGWLNPRVSHQPNIIHQLLLLWMEEILHHWMVYPIVSPDFFHLFLRVQSPLDEICSISWLICR